MKRFSKHYSIQDLIAGCEGSLHLVNDANLNNASELTDANENSLCFYESSKYLAALKELNAGLVIVPRSFAAELLPQTNLFYTEKPYVTFNRLIKKWLETEPQSLPSHHIHLSAVMRDDTILDDTVTVRENVVIGSNVAIGKNTIIEANVVIADNVVIGNDCHIYPNVTIYTGSEIGNRVVIHAGSVIGSDGFGYLFNEGKQEKIYHTGKVIIDDDVEIGANTCIDRSTLGATVVGKGTKIDNLVQIGHNCRIGSHSIICAQVGLAGNTEIGNYVYLAGQVGAAGHLKIEDRAMVGAQSGIAGNIPAGAKYLGTPATEASLQKRIMVSWRKLPEMVKAFSRKNREEE